MYRQQLDHRERDKTKHALDWPKTMNLFYYPNLCFQLLSTILPSPLLKSCLGLCFLFSFDIKTKNKNKNKTKAKQKKTKYTIAYA